MKRIICTRSIKRKKKENDLQPRVSQLDRSDPQRPHVSAGGFDDGESGVVSVGDLAKGQNVQVPLAYPRDLYVCGTKK